MITDDMIKKYKYGTEDTAGIIYFAEDQYRTDTGDLIVLEEWQKKILNDIFLEGKYNLALIGLGKKNGKSTMASLLAEFSLFFSNEPAPAEVIGIAGDKDQAKIIFNKTKNDLMRNGDLADLCKFTADSIEVRSTGAIYRVIASDYQFRTAHGLNPSCVIVDEAWLVQEDAWAALTFSPVRINPIYFVVSYGGFNGEDNLLSKLYKMGLEGENKKMYFNWYLGEEGSFKGWKKANPASWITREYLEQQKRILTRDNDFRRLHLAQFVETTSDFITTDLYDQIEDGNLTRVREDRSLRCVAGVDASRTRDWTACVTVAKIKDKFRVVDTKVWKPSPNNPIDFGQVEKYIHSLKRRFRLVEILYDPYAFASTAQRLRTRGVRCVEYAQTTANLTRSGTALFDAIVNRDLTVYHDTDLKRSILNCSVKENERGWKLTKSGRGKIDLAVALSFALIGAESLPSSGARLFMRSHHTGFFAPVLSRRKSYPSVRRTGDGAGAVGRIIDLNFGGK